MLVMGVLWLQWIPDSEGAALFSLSRHTGILQYLVGLET